MHDPGVDEAMARPRHRRMGPHVLTWTELRKRSQKLEFPAGSGTTCDLDKSRMAASEYKAKLQGEMMVTRREVSRCPLHVGGGGTVAVGTTAKSFMAMNSWIE